MCACCIARGWAGRGVGREFASAMARVRECVRVDRLTDSTDVRPLGTASTQVVGTQGKWIGGRRCKDVHRRAQGEAWWEMEPQQVREGGKVLQGCGR